MTRNEYMANCFHRDLLEAIPDFLETKAMHALLSSSAKGIPSCNTQDFIAFIKQECVKDLKAKRGRSGKSLVQTAEEFVANDIGYTI